MSDMNQAEKMSNLRSYQENAAAVQDVRDQLRTVERRLIRSIGVLGSDPLGMEPMWSGVTVEEGAIRLASGRRGA